MLDRNLKLHRRTAFSAHYVPTVLDFLEEYDYALIEDLARNGFTEFEVAEAEGDSRIAVAYWPQHTPTNALFWLERKSTIFKLECRSHEAISPLRRSPHIPLTLRESAHFVGGIGLALAGLIYAREQDRIHEVKLSTVEPFYLGTVARRRSA